MYFLPICLICSRIAAPFAGAAFVLQSRYMNDFLAGLVGSAARAKILRLFVFNRGEEFTVDDVAKRTQVTKPNVRKELRTLEKTGLLKKKVCFVAVEKKQGQKTVVTKKRTPGWVVNEQFEFLPPLLIFLRDISPAQYDDISKKLRGVGKIKLIIASGSFMDDSASKVDILVVGDRLDERKLQASLRGIEAELGRELAYAGFTTDEFRYRLNVYDKLIRDVLDYPHQVLVDRLGVTHS